MSIFIDKNKLFQIEINGNYITDALGNSIGFKINQNGDINITAYASGRDFERMSKIIEDASIINSVTGKPLLRSSVFCKMIILYFFKEIHVKNYDNISKIQINQETIKNIQYDLIKKLSQKWLEITDGG